MSYYSSVIDEMALFREEFSFLNKIEDRGDYKYSYEKKDYLEQFLPERQKVKVNKSRIFEDDYLLCIYKSKQIRWD